MTSSPDPRRPRAYALPFVLFVAVSLGVVVGGLFALLNESVASSRQAEDELQQLYGCDGALRLALDEVSRKGIDADIAKQQQALGALTAALQTDINPRTGRPFADLESVIIQRTSSETLPVTRAPFHGMQFIQEARELIVEANPLASRGRTCRAESPNRLRTISYFQFAVVSNDRISEFAEIRRTAGTNGEIFTLEHGTQFPPLFPQSDVRSIRLEDNQTFRPVPPSGQPWSFINKKKKTFGGTKRRTRHKAPMVEYFTKYPTNSPSIDPTLSRFAMQADIRIVDGEWFLPGTDGTFPGRRIWSDRPGAFPNGRFTNRSLSFSAYESESASDKAKGGSAVVRYGMINGTARSAVQGACDPDDVAFFQIASDGTTVPACPPPPDPPPPDAPPPLDIDAYLESAKQPFFDPFQTDGQSTAMLPIVVDVRALGAALSAPGTDDIGEARCLSDNPTACPESKRFQGSLWVGTLPASFEPGSGRPRSRESGAAHQPLPTGDKRTPCPLAAAGSTDCQRPNAVVIVNADNLDVFRLSGLSIASNLPIYVVGDINLTNIPRVALLAPVVTGLTRGFDLTTLSKRSATATLAAAAASSELTWNTSLFTAWVVPLRLFASVTRHPEQHTLRAIEPGLRIDVNGSMVLMFDRARYATRLRFNPSNGSFSDPESDPIQEGVPTFSAATGFGSIFDNTNREELGQGAPGRSRLARVRLRFPGAGAQDLRRADIAAQPPAAPRFSIDPAPVDRR